MDVDLGAGSKEDFFLVAADAEAETPLEEADLEALEQVDGPSDPLAAEAEVPLLLGQEAGPMEADGQEDGPLLEAEAEGQLEVP